MFLFAHKERGEIRRGKVDVFECRLVSNLLLCFFYLQLPERSSNVRTQKVDRKQRIRNDKL